MLISAKADIVTDGSGDATVYITHGVNKALYGLLLVLKYTPGTIDTGADLTITGETSGVPIITITDAGTSNVFYYPRALLNEVADASAGTSGTELIPINNERIKVVVAQGTATKSGSIEAILMDDGRR